MLLEHTSFIYNGPNCRIYEAFPLFLPANHGNYMSKTPSIYQKWLEQLLTEQESEVVLALKNLPESKLNPVGIYALTLVWQLHEEEKLQEEAYHLLKAQCPTSELEALAQHLKFFKSIADAYPWMEKDVSLEQQENFETFSKVAKQFEPFFANHPYYTEILLDAGRKLYMFFSLEKEATFCFNMILQHNKKQDEALYALGRIKEKQKQHEKALVYYEESIEANPKNTYAQLQTGILKATIFEEYEQAIEHYNIVIENDPYAAAPYVQVAVAYYKMEDYERCRQFIEIVLGINEFQEEALNLLGLLAWKVEGDYEKAIEIYQKGLDHQIHGNSALLLGSLGKLYIHYQQDYEKARLYLEKSLEVHPGQLEILEELTPILLEVFHDHAAIEYCYENYLKVYPTDVLTRTTFAQFLIEYVHAYEKANEQLISALELDPNLVTAQKLQERIKAYIMAEEEEDIEEEDFDDDDDDDDFSGGHAAGDH